jgi:hypothetical protein
MPNDVTPRVTQTNAVWSMCNQQRVALSRQTCTCLAYCCIWKSNPGPVSIYLYKCLQLHERTGGSIGVPNDVTRAAVTPSSFLFAPNEVILFLRPCNVKSSETVTQKNQKLVLRATNRRQDVKWCPLHQCPVVVCAVTSAVDGSPPTPIYFNIISVLNFRYLFQIPVYQSEFLYSDKNPSISSGLCDAVWNVDWHYKLP